MRSILLAVAVVFAFAGCDTLFSVSSAGTVIVSVVDAVTGLPLQGVSVTLHLRDGAGSQVQVSQVTGPAGATTFELDDIGRLSASVEPPTGYVEGEGGLTRELIVNRGETVSLVFPLQPE